MGKQMAAQAQPLKIRYKKPKKKGDHAEATLDVATTSAHASLLTMQKGMLLEKINYIFGEAIVTDIRFIHTPANIEEKNTKPKAKLTEAQKKALSDMLESIEDEDIRAKLMDMGTAFFEDQKT